MTGQLSYEPLLISFVVAMWAGGFDLIYSTSDYNFDREYGIHSVPSRIGIAETLWLARIMHFLSVSALLALGILLELAWPYYIGWAIAVALLIYENAQVRPDDLSKIGAVFFRVKRVRLGAIDGIHNSGPWWCNVSPQQESSQNHGNAHKPIIVGISGAKRVNTGPRHCGRPCLRATLPTIVVCSNAARLVWQEELDKPFSETLVGME